jgi:hypothetical protein
MVPIVVSARPVGKYELDLEFDDGVAGRVDVAELIALEGVFAPLRDLGFFKQAYVDEDLGSVAWPNGADLDPLVLYAKVKGVEVESLLTGPPIER